MARRRDNLPERKGKARPSKKANSGAGLISPPDELAQIVDIIDRRSHADQKEYYNTIYLRKGFCRTNSCYIASKIGRMRLAYITVPTYLAKRNLPLFQIVLEEGMKLNVEMGSAFSSTHLLKAFRVTSLKIIFIRKQEEVRQ